MRNWTTPQQRLRFHEQHLSGRTYGQIAAESGASVACVRYWCRRQRDGGSPQSRYPAGPQGLLRHFDGLVRLALLRLRLQHPRWGPNRLRAKLAQRRTLRGLALPSAAAIGRYLHQWPRFRRRRRPQPAPAQRPDAPQHVHQRWQMDFKLGIALGDGTQANLTTLCDPVGEVCIGAQATPAGPQGHPPRHVQGPEAQQALRLAFAFWHTLPRELQTDNDSVIVGPRAQGAFPTYFSLWLIALGIAHLTTRPAHPTDNAEVERCHRTVSDYAIAGPAPADLAHLQQRLDEALLALAFELPSRAPGCRRRPPAVAHPELTQPRGSFAPDLELAHCDLARVDRYLACSLWQRTVNKTGQIYLNDQAYSVGRKYARQQVLACFDPDTRRFVFFAHDWPYAEIGSRPALHLELADLLCLNVRSVSLTPQQLALPFDDSPGGIT